MTTTTAAPLCPTCDMSYLLDGETECPDCVSLCDAIYFGNIEEIDARDARRA